MKKFVSWFYGVFSAAPLIVSVLSSAIIFALLVLAYNIINNYFGSTAAITCVVIGFIGYSATLIRMVLSNAGGTNN